MKKTILIALVLLGIKLIAHDRTDSKINVDRPSSTFDTNMVITLYNGGGMYYGSTNIDIRFDSIIYTKMDHGVDHVTRIAMTSELRQKVVNILDDHRFYYLKSEPCELIHDKATTSVCIRKGRGFSTCVMSGATERVAEKDRADFNSVWTKLEELSQVKK